MPVFHKLPSTLENLGCLLVPEYYQPRKSKPTPRSEEATLRVLFVPILVLAISACTPTVPLDKYNSDIATANAEISMATAIIQSFSANATVIAARLYTAEVCVEAMSSMAEMDCETAMSASTSTPTPSPVARSSLAPFATPAPASPSEGQRTYFDPEYGFSITYPAHLDILVSESVPSLYLGEQIHVAIGDVNPLDCRGDCPLVESINPATVAGLDATRVEGYKGAIGGEIPQRYLQYILKHDNRYYSFTLWALRRDAKNECCSIIWPLNDNDIALFEQLLNTLTFIN
jgi:hypothetical protein